MVMGPAHCCVRGSWPLWLQWCAQEGSQQGGVDGAMWGGSEQEIGVDLLGARQGHGLQGCPEGIGCGVMQAEQSALLCERGAGVLTVEVEGGTEKARSAGGEWMTMCRELEAVSRSSGCARSCVQPPSARWCEGVLRGKAEGNGGMRK
ncbi:hypothetical protein [Dictyobacter halimunensis]|uniref:hypothetical protein n=1 Tax=Dictyobacter halimunensis TaxID=3026934 RepID=UPI0030C69BCB